MAETKDSSAKVILYWLEGSRAHRIVWLLEELKVPYEVQVFKRTKQALAPRELAKVHPLGKSPVIAVRREGHPDLVIAESGLIIEYIIDHWGPQFKPKRYSDGQEGQIAAETEAYMRDRWYMHFSEGSLMPNLIYKLVTTAMRGKKVPFFAKPVTSLIAGKIESAAVHPRVYQQLDYLEQLAEKVPDGGPYLCGKTLTASDFIMSYPIQGAQFAGMLQRYPKLSAWLAQIESLPAYKAAIEKAKQINGGEFSLFPDV